MNQPKKKIVLLSCFYEPFMSGAEQMPREIIARLSGKYDITIVAARLDRKLARTEARGNYRLVRVGIGHKAIDKLLYPLLAALEVRRIKPEIAHANLESYAGMALVWLRWLYPRARRILTLQSGNLLDKGQKNIFFIKLFWRRINSAPDRILAISRFLKDRSLAAGAPEEKIGIIPNGVDFSKVVRRNNPQKHLVFFSGRLAWEKGAEYMFRAWPEVLKKFPDAKLLQVGGGDMRGEIMALIEKLKIGDAVILKPAMPYEEYLRQYEKAEVMVCPSLAEGLGIAFIEAQASGVPAIGTRVGGISDVITDGENGLLIEPKDSAAIAAAVIRLLSDRELASRLAARALETVKKFDWENVVKQIDDIYRKYLGV